MKLSRHYNSIERFGEKFRLLLLLLLLGQIFYLNISSVKIPLPAFVIDKIFNDYLTITPSISIRIQDSYLLGFSNIQISKIEFAQENKVFAKIEGLEIDLNPRFFALNNEAAFRDIQISKIIIDFKSKSQELFLGRNLKLLGGKEASYQVSGSFALGQHEIKILGKLNLPVEFSKSSGSRFRVEDFLELAEQKTEMALNYAQSIPRMRLESLLNFSDDSMYLYTRQINDDQNHIIDNLRLISKLEFSTKKKFHLKAIADSVLIEIKNQDFEFPQPEIDLEIDFSEDFSMQAQTLPKARISTKQVKLRGKLEGVFPKFVLQSSNTLNKIVYISDNKELEASTSSYWKDGYMLHRGFLNFNPVHWDLFAKLPQGTLKLIDGKSLKIRLSENFSPKEENSLCQFSIQADDFSALETPPGNFLFIGEAEDDLAINIYHAYGKFGSSQAIGRYTQTWNPSKFRFLVKGNCMPSDIENWLGTWWMPLFSDCSFKDNAPYGDFSISGIWGGKAGNSQTFGSIIANDFLFRNWRINDSQIDVLVEENSTELRTKQISHSLGSLSGSLLFPHNRLNSDLLLKFDVSGDFPLNDARKVLGPRIENTLNGIDAPIVRCNGSGKIFRNTTPLISDANFSQFNIGIESVVPIYYQGIPIHSLSGSIESEKGVIKGHFPQIEIANGSGVLLFEELSRESDRIKIKFNLNNAERYQFINSLERVNLTDHNQKKENLAVPITKEQSAEDRVDGKLNLSLLAEGPASDPLQFKGSGICILTDVEVGNINFLGGIRSKLGAFNLPLPSDALSFNRLEAPFHLDHEFMHFDEINLSGPLSLLTARGSINIESEQVDLMADLKLAGNLNIPLVKQLVNFADPLPKMSTIKITGPWDNPDWRVHISPNP